MMNGDHFLDVLKNQEPLADIHGVPQHFLHVV
jgi:hypothetical protein